MSSRFRLRPFHAEIREHDAIANDFIFFDEAETQSLKQRSCSDGCFDVNARNSESGAGSDGVFYQGCHYALALEFRVRVSAVDMTIGIQFKKSGDVLLNHRDEGTLDFATFSPVIVVDSAGRPSFALFRRVVGGSDLMDGGGEDLRNRDVITMLENTDHDKIEERGW